ncbi:hypothetical protein KVV02_006589 [Mortierella alpina]|uniref:Aminotransferase class V domain-containing protein n=1 Tax=Mortierella alpina TaxID=64518 RepID=A0A9P8D1M5_MORAP|nr:hypothetical protein KVV02_006589 [Mortierella alpina]
MDPSIQLADWARLKNRHQRLLIRRIQSDIIASPWIANPPFGRKKSIYTDFFASSKPLKKFESIMTQQVLPFYANTHTSTTSTSKVTSHSVKLARETIARCTRTNTEPGHEHEAEVIFCGDGSTSGINKVRNVFRLGDEAFWSRKAHAASSAPSEVGPSLSISLSLPSSSFHSPLLPKHRPVVFLSIQEHHSNLLPWRESCADVVVIPEDGSHRLDLRVLEQQLIEHCDRPLKIGTFSAGSNLTGVLNDTVAISELLHRHGAYAFFDYAGVGPYTAIDMNPTSSSPSHPGEPNLAYKDGVFLSTHKFLGGPGSSGVLIARVEIFSWVDRSGVHLHNNNKKWHAYASPANPGGGTVDMVIDGKHKYSSSVIAREEAGTPNILATIRTGLVFRLQEIVDPAWILEKEYRLAKRVMARLTASGLAKAIHVLGASSEEQDRVAVFSLTVTVPPFVTLSKMVQQRPPPPPPPPQDQGVAEHINNDPPLQIHYALLSTIMNDFFGIEMRGGCMCAGPYASKLLQFDAAKEATFWRLLMGETGHDGEDDNDDGDDKGAHRQQQKRQQRDLRSKSLKPGFVRLSFSYFARDKDVEFVLQSLEWVAQYGYLLVPLYTLDANSGEWSTREAVRKAVYAEIPPIHARWGSRECCIPTAVDCIYGLKKLFRDQQALLPSRPSTSSNASAHSLSTVPPRMRSDAMSVTMRDDRDDRDDHDQAVLGDSFPSSSEYSSMNSGFSAVAVTRQSHGPEHGPAGASSASSLSLSSPSGPGGIDGGCRDPVAAKRVIKKNRFGFFSSAQQRSISTQKRQGFKQQVLEELGAATLQREVEAVENSPLAKELRWFVMPWEVAQVYRRHLMHPSDVSSPFPKRV